MQYQPIDFTAVPQIAWIIAMVCAGAAISGLSLINFGSKDTPKKRKEWLNKVLGILLALSAVAVLSFTVMDLVVKYENKAKAATNILQKYNIQKVIWTDYRASPYGDGSAKRNEPNVLVLVNNEEHVYRYEVNRETSEPTLKDVTEHSGKQTTPGPKAETLVKEKSK